MGYFITFEGVEGCGKTTQIKLLSDFLSTRGMRTVLTREPGGCPIADKIRTILLDAENRALSPLAELMLYAAARAQHVAEIISPALESGGIVLCDRFAMQRWHIRVTGAASIELSSTPLTAMHVTGCHLTSPYWSIVTHASAWNGHAAELRRPAALARSALSWRNWLFISEFVPAICNLRLITQPVF